MLKLVEDNLASKYHCNIIDLFSTILEGLKRCGSSSFILSHWTNCSPSWTIISTPFAAATELMHHCHVSSPVTHIPCACIVYDVCNYAVELFSCVCINHHGSQFYFAFAYFYFSSDLFSSLFVIWSLSRAESGCSFFCFIVFT